MKRLTTETPDGNLEQALNLFFGDGPEVMVRSGGPAPDYKDITLTEYIKRIIKEHNAEIDTDVDIENLNEEMDDCLFDGPKTITGLIATLYTAGWAFAELRHRLKMYEDAEEDGQLLMLPCHIGDTLYRLDEGKIYKVKAISMRIHEDGVTILYRFNKFGYCEGSGVFGKTLFRTKEEAEKAAKDGKDGQDGIKRGN